MELLKVLSWIFIIITQVACLPQPDHHVHHRIIIPQKIKTIHHTKIIKVPEHHHYFHEKEKIVHIETPKKEEIPSLPLEDEHDDWSESSYLGGGSHNIFKKHALSAPKHHKRNTSKSRKRPT